LIIKEDPSLGITEEIFPSFNSISACNGIMLFNKKTDIFRYRFMINNFIQIKLSIKENYGFTQQSTGQTATH
jgi:hypothetical protein